ncbi:MAG: transporter, partial [Verrucomicrobiota bacterium]
MDAQHRAIGLDDFEVTAQALIVAFLGEAQGFLGAGVAAPIIDGGANKANYQAALSRRDEALAAYRNSLLVALREVEDCLADLKGLARSRAALERALTSAQE